MVHLRGERERAHRMFDALSQEIPADWDLTTQDVIAREYYAERLAAEGRAAEAIPLLETAERTYIERPLREYDLRRVRETLGDAYDRIGRQTEARRTLGAARAERMAKDAPGSIAVLGVRERWARFLLDAGRNGGGARGARGRSCASARIARSIPLALAHADLAQEAIARRDATTALVESNKALATLDRITGLYDVRVGPRLWRTHAAALALSGDARSAADWNARALEASRRYDDPASPTVALAAARTLGLRRRELPVQPGLGERPLTAHRAFGDAEHARGFRLAVAGEVAAFDDPRRPRQLLRELLEGIVERDQALVAVDAQVAALGERNV